ncbi:ribosome maturation factor RimP [candidate division TA06 bacterium]|nr:ribosome maturation factor RimP [candidate division TA06 bacterium]
MPSEAEIINKVSDLAGSFLNEMGLELYDVEYSSVSGSLRVFIQRPQSGVSMGDCAKVSRKLSEELDKEDLIDSAYMLEVSSPGLDRPLKKETDYQRSLGRLAKMKLVKPVDGSYELLGRLLEYREGTVKVGMEGQEPIWIPLSQIKKARLELEKSPKP